MVMRPYNTPLMRPSNTPLMRPYNTPLMRPYKTPHTGVCALDGDASMNFVDKG